MRFCRTLMSPPLLGLALLLAPPLLDAAPAAADIALAWDERRAFDPPRGSLYERWERERRDRGRHWEFQDTWRRPSPFFLDRRPDLVIRDRFGRRVGIAEPAPFGRGYIVRDRFGRIIGSLDRSRHWR